MQNLEVAKMITDMAQMYNHTLGDLAMEAYLTVLQRYDVRLVHQAILEVVVEELFIPRPVTIKQKISELQSIQRSNTPAIEPPPVSDKDRTFGQAMTQLHVDWIRSGHCTSRPKGMIYEQDFVNYMKEHGVEAAIMGRYVGYCRQTGVRLV
jgi:hypothetical protein